MKKCKSFASLKASVSLFNNPEKINAPLSTAPSKRIQSVLPDYDKTLNGNLLAKEIGLPVMKSRYTHFSVCVDKLIKTRWTMLFLANLQILWS